MDGSNMGANIGTFKGMFGLKTYYEVDGKLQFDVQDPKYREMILFMNKLSRQGLIDPEWALSKREKWLQNIGNANFLGTPAAYWDLGTPNTNLKKAGGEDKQYFQYKVVAPGVDPAKTTYGPTSTLGWDAIGISNKNKHPEETMKFINFLASEEGQTLLMWGMEGVTYEIKDGKKTPLPGVLDKFKQDWDKTVKETGVRKWTWFVKGGTGPDDTTRDMAARYDRGEVDRFAIKTLGDSGWVTDAYDNLGPLGGTPEILIAQKVKDIMDQTLTMVINAKTEEEANKTFDKMLADMKAAGSEKVEKIINEHYQERLALWK
jgi:putative aldouronate transport system substrate-binding protein